MVVSEQRAPEQRALTVSQLSEMVKLQLEELFQGVWVTGEIADFSRPASGHIYFTLKDPSAQIRCVIWRSTASRLRFQPKDGLQVICQGDMNVYAPRGNYQLVLRTMEPVGEGVQRLALRQLHARLSREGLFDPARKRPLPLFPRRIGLVTSPTGAAVRDFLEVARRRWQGLHILICPTRVQGDGAVDDIVKALASAQSVRPALDVIVVARGGGSIDDLACFNDERVVRAIHASPIPIVSAVGHEIDVTLCDLVADVRALTPTEAAERVVPSRDEVNEQLVAFRRRLAAAVTRRLNEVRLRLGAIANSRSFRRPYALVDDRTQLLDEYQQRARRAIDRCLRASRESWSQLGARLHALSPLATLRRGYSVTLRSDRTTMLKNADEINAGESIVTRLDQGWITSQVVSKESNRETDPS
ncbi:MAG: exodeoxyribonuclease VII large subunit [Planctomycetes bacterium]|nr:exodeoxyribonuclease VII large subunit [Planctomycetota bacterium]